MKMKKIRTRDDDIKMTEQSRMKNEEKEDKFKAAFCDEYRPDHNNSSDTSFHHAQAEVDEERQQPLIVRWESESEEGQEEDDDADHDSLKPVECNS